MNILRRVTDTIPVLSGVILAICSSGLSANYFELQNPADSVMGETRMVVSRYEDTLLDIARANGLGYNDIKLINSQLDTWIPGEGKDVVLPTQFILPQAPRRGIVLNIPEMRLYFYPEQKKGQPVAVYTYPLGIGREGWATPYISTRVIEKRKHPVWYPTASVRAEHAEMDDPLPEFVGPGPDNPLGDYAMRLGMPQYLIHGTNRPFGVGFRVSHGCIRLYPENIEQLFEKVTVGTPVNIVNQPYKVGQLGDAIFLEAHPYLSEDQEQFAGNMTIVVKLLIKITDGKSYEIDWKLADQVLREMRGIPVEIGRLTGPEQESETVPVKEAERREMPSLAVERGIELRLDSGMLVRKQNKKNP